ncbi:helix-hairpin-helix domain-containing protein [Paratractidigestivibacter faecalis]|uniref:helix-hairpin-helix domain-containing protein n=1 Tax=Paratractidigestivibacter faecalis TaxID=2292441 RepID=UPI003A8D6986
MQRAAKGGLARRLLAGRVPALMAALVVICLAGVLLTLGRGSGVTIERSDGEEAAGQEADASEGSEAAETEAPVLVVHVDGCVASPGVYELAGPDLRVNDAVEAAGGLLPEADTSQMNLAAGLSDGQKVLVPARAEKGAAAAAPGGGAASQTDAGSLVNINLATADQLQALSGVGEATARAIVEDREAHGPFSSVEDLMRVSGIGQKKFDKLKGQICV